MKAPQSYSEIAGEWYAGLRYEQLPVEVQCSTKRLVLNSLAIAIAASKTEEYGAIASRSCAGQHGPCQVLGTAVRASATAAALANGMLFSCLGFDDSLPETLIHVSAATVSCALGMAQTRPTTGKEFLAAIAGGNELVCRIGLVAPLQFHKHGLHPSGIIGAIGAAYVAARLAGLSGDKMRDAVGIAGNMASGINQSWVDGSHAQFIDSGWAAAGAITAAQLAVAGLDGPAQVLEGRFGLFRSHLQDPSVRMDFARMVSDLGGRWDCLDIEMKRFPTGHVNLPFVQAVLQLYEQDGVRADQVRKMTASVAGWMMPVVCEPAAEKRRPGSDLHAKVSLPYTLAETLVHGRLGAGSYTRKDLQDPRILEVVDRTECLEDPQAPKSDVYKGTVCVELNDGRRLERTVLHGKGLQFPLEQFRAKFDDCMRFAGHAAASEPLWQVVEHLDEATSLDALDGLLATIH